MDIDVRPNARVRYLGETRYMCPEQHAVLEFVAETIVKVAQEAVDTGVPYIEDPLTARLFLDKYRLLAEMDSDPARITEDCPVVPPTNDRMTMEIGDSEQGESSMPQGLSHGGTNRSSGTNNPTDQSAFNHPREYGISIRGRAAGHSFGRERNVNSFSAEPAHSAGIPTRYQEEPPTQIPISLVKRILQESVSGFRKHIQTTSGLLIVRDVRDDSSIVADVFSLSRIVSGAWRNFPIRRKCFFMSVMGSADRRSITGIVGTRRRSCG